MTSTVFTISLDRDIIGTKLLTKFHEDRTINVASRVFTNKWGAPGLVMGPCIVEIDRIVIRDVQYQLQVNRCRNEEVNFQGSSAYSVGGDSGQDKQTDGWRR
ncbi:hypothetical protein DPMN_108871 [Dreissena polymorpha]|uniref:Uncharacterized protein n=1 Tax=Dreissena polymorpha TaxID=45954 RepID=A0A9D4K9L6_DREPO|nr:hypothetical protein DPMN_108871 [Dreissena polymorpha]